MFLLIDRERNAWLESTVDSDWVFYTHTAGTSSDVAFLKIQVALVAAASVIRLSVMRAHTDRQVQVFSLGVAAALAILCFFNLGHPQFWDNENRKTTFVHTFDMRVYFPSVKYFDELGYDGVYWASALAYLEDNGPEEFSKIQHRTIRDLRDYSTTTVGRSVTRASRPQSAG